MIKGYVLMIRPKVVDVGLLRKILNDPMMLCHERGAARATIATCVGGGDIEMCCVKDCGLSICRWFDCL